MKITKKPLKPWDFEQFWTREWDRLAQEYPRDEFGDISDDDRDKVTHRTCAAQREWALSVGWTDVEYGVLVNEGDGEKLWILKQNGFGRWKCPGEVPADFEGYLDPGVDLRAAARKLTKLLPDSDVVVNFSVEHGAYYTVDIDADLAHMWCPRDLGFSESLEHHWCPVEGCDCPCRKS